MKNNDWDVVIMSHDQFGFIPQSDEVQAKMILDELKQLDDSPERRQGYSWENSRHPRGLERERRT